MSGPAEIRDEPPDGPAARALFDEYTTLVRARLPEGWVAPAHVFGSSDAFAGDGAAWLVVYDAGATAIGCGGLRVLDGETGEIKRMFVSARARGAGHGRRLLRELERRAAAAGLRHVRLVTTEVLTEACGLYAAEGYEEIERTSTPGQPVEIWLEKALYS